MFSRKRGDTKVATIEKNYAVNLNARGDMLLRNILEERCFDSQTQLLDALSGRLTEHARKRRLFISFHKEDAAYLNGFNLMAHNPRVALDFYNNSLRDTINSDRRAYVKDVIRELINRASVLVCLIGNGTAWREWVEWELETAVSLSKGICGVRIPGTYGRVPAVIRQTNAPVADWETASIIRTIEYAAAKRS
jgi:MTH538 TIR-like domain (DUF1863)